MSIISILAKDIAQAVQQLQLQQQQQQQQQPVTAPQQQPVTAPQQPGYTNPEYQAPALAEQKRLSELQAAQMQADYIQRTRGLVNPGLNNPVQNIPIRTLPQPGISLFNPGLNNPVQNIPIRTLPQPGIRGPMPRVNIAPNYEEFIRNATSQSNQTNTGQQYQTALQALEAFKKANPSPESYSGYGADPQLKAQYDQIYGNYQRSMIPYFQEQYKTQGMA